MSEDPLVGRWFHGFSIEGDLTCAGKIEGRLASGQYLIHILRWVCGCRPTTRILTADDMAASTDVFGTEEEMLLAWNTHRELSQLLRKHVQ